MYTMLDDESLHAQSLRPHEVRASADFMRGRRSAARRFGGYDEIELSDAERVPLGWWSQDWRWFSSCTA